MMLYDLCHHFHPKKKPSKIIGKMFDICTTGKLAPADFSDVVFTRARFQKLQRSSLGMRILCTNSLAHAFFYILW